MNGYRYTCNFFFRNGRCSLDTIFISENKKIADKQREEFRRKIKTSLAQDKLIYLESDFGVIRSEDVIEIRFFEESFL